MKFVLTAKTLYGNWGTLLLPVNRDNSIDFPGLSRQIDYLIASNVDGIYSNGTAGEFYNQTEKEFDSIQTMLAEKCSGKGIKFQIGGSHMSPVISLERIKRTASLKPDAFQVILPDWVSADTAEQETFLAGIAEAAEGTPVVLYNPPHARNVLNPAEYAGLQNKVPALIGIKVAGGDANWFNEMRRHAASLSVFVPGHLLATGYKEKVAAGAYSNVACLSPKGAQLWWKIIQTDITSALEIQERILKFFELVILPYKKQGFSNPALDKYLAAIGGWSYIGTRLKWPYKSIDEKDVPKARETAISLLPEFFSNM